MYLSIEKNSTVGELKKQFAGFFSNLKLEVFSAPHSSGQGSPASQLLADDRTLYSITGNQKEGQFYFEPTNTVANFEEALKKQFGLSVQVFRRSGKIWLETVQTDNLDLQQQNEMDTDIVGKVRFNINTLFL